MNKHLEQKAGRGEKRNVTATTLKKADVSTKKNATNQPRIERSRVSPQQNATKASTPKSSRTPTNKDAAKASKLKSSRASTKKGVAKKPKTKTSRAATKKVVAKKPKTKTSRATTKKGAAKIPRTKQSRAIKKTTASAAGSKTRKHAKVGVVSAGMLLDEHLAKRRRMFQVLGLYPWQVLHVNLLREIDHQLDSDQRHFDRFLDARAEEIHKLQSKQSERSGRITRATLKHKSAQRLHKEDEVFYTYKQPSARFAHVLHMPKREEVSNVAELIKRHPMRRVTKPSKSSDAAHFSHMEFIGARLEFRKVHQLIDTDLLNNQLVEGVKDEAQRGVLKMATSLANMPENEQVATKATAASAIPGTLLLECSTTSVKSAVGGDVIRVNKCTPAGNGPSENHIHSLSDQLKGKGDGEGRMLLSALYPPKSSAEQTRMRALQQNGSNCVKLYGTAYEDGPKIVVMHYKKSAAKGVFRAECHIYSVDELQQQIKRPHDKRNLLCIMYGKYKQTTECPYDGEGTSAFTELLQLYDHKQPATPLVGGERTLARFIMYYVSDKLYNFVTQTSIFKKLQGFKDKHLKNHTSGWRAILGSAMRRTAQGVSYAVDYMYKHPVLAMIFPLIVRATRFWLCTCMGDKAGCGMGAKGIRQAATTISVSLGLGYTAVHFVEAVLGLFLAVPQGKWSEATSHLVVIGTTLFPTIGTSVAKFIITTVKTLFSRWLGGFAEYVVVLVDKVCSRSPATWINKDIRTYPGRALALYCTCFKVFFPGQDCADYNPDTLYESKLRDFMGKSYYARYIQSVVWYVAFLSAMSSPALYRLLWRLIGMMIRLTVYLLAMFFGKSAIGTAALVIAQGPKNQHAPDHTQATSTEALTQESWDQHYKPIVQKALPEQTAHVNKFVSNVYLGAAHPDKVRSFQQRVASGALLCKEMLKLLNRDVSMCIAAKEIAEMWWMILRFGMIRVLPKWMCEHLGLDVTRPCLDLVVHRDVIQPVRPVKLRGSIPT